MLCRKHSTTQAAAVCSACGAGMCSNCTRETHAGKLVCSAQCQETADKATQAINEILKKSRFGIAFTATMFIIIGSGMLLVGLIGFVMVPRLLMGNIYSSGAGVVFIILGIYASRKYKSLT